MEDTNKSPPTTTPSPLIDFTPPNLLQINRRFLKRVRGTRRAPVARYALYELDAARTKTWAAMAKLHQIEDMVGTECVEYVEALNVYELVATAERNAWGAARCALPPMSRPGPGDSLFTERYSGQLNAAPYPEDGTTDEPKQIRRKMTADIVECAFIETTFKLHEANGEVQRYAQKIRKTTAKLSAAKGRRATARDAYSGAIRVLSQFTK